ncbi:rhomboid domain-containing protein 3 isoform X2 [Lethenteron reissneri]|uniref:rhomboid domain-containing protein 3 isoform X2 n=1 Tax=Lethenteron reissneri TaxID=7753 RepID=UPI002AB6D1DA|nr:rhomboid domain-containing protein 3 isoform X2 [Lethenteron reissneri]
MRAFLPASVPAVTTIWIIAALFVVILTLCGYVDETALALDPSRMGLNLQVYRLVTHPMCPWGLAGLVGMGAWGWLPSPLLVGLLGVPLERLLGSARFGLLALLTSLLGGLLGLVLWTLLGPPPMGIQWAPAWGPIPGLVGALAWATWPRAGNRRYGGGGGDPPGLMKLLGTVPAWVLPWGALGLSELFVPGAPTLTGGLAALVGIALHCGICERLFPSPASLASLERWVVVRWVVPRWVRVVPSHCGHSSLPTHRYNPPAGSYPTQPPPMSTTTAGPPSHHHHNVPTTSHGRPPPPPPPPVHYWGVGSSAITTGPPPPHHQHHHHLANVPTTSHGRPPPVSYWGDGAAGRHGDEEEHGEEERRLDEVMLRAAIAASLAEGGGGGGGGEGVAEIPQNSVSAFRLSQLEAMGFPRAPSVVALAASRGGRVEGAVGLLAEGGVGVEARVTAGHHNHHHHNHHHHNQEECSSHQQHHHHVHCQHQH